MFETYDLHNFGERIRSIRKSLNYSQTEVCDQTDINRDTLSKIENGHTIATFDTLNRLSIFFKKDLLHELAHYNSNRTLLNYYDRIDDIINSYDYERILSLSDDFEAQFKGKLAYNYSLYERNLISQFRLAIKGIESFFKEDKDSTEIIDILIKALKLTIKDFDIRNFKVYKYNLFELRILLLIGVSLSEIKKYKESNKILKFILKSLSFDKEALPNEKKLIIKVFSNISYNYHYLDKHEKVLEYADRGIKYCRDNDVMYALNHLYYRKGIAEYFLNKDEKVYKDSLMKSIHMLEIKGYDDLADEYKKITYDKYDIDLNREKKILSR